MSAGCAGCDPHVCSQLTRADLSTMTPREIEAARVAGRLADLLTPPPATGPDLTSVMNDYVRSPTVSTMSDPVAEMGGPGATGVADQLAARAAQGALTGHQLTRADLATMTPSEIADAHRDGRFDALLGSHDWRR